MNPTTTLDSHYSDPKAIAVGWDEIRKLLEAAEFFWICTVRPDGRPHVTPLGAVWLDGAIHFHTGANEQKFANLRDNPHVVLITGCNQWDRGVDVVVGGDAVLVTDPAVLERLATAWTRKWDGRWDALAEVFSVVPTTIYAHSKGDRSARPCIDSDLPNIRARKALSEVVSRGQWLQVWVRFSLWW